MHDDFSTTLFFPLERGIVPEPSAAAPALVFGAGRGTRLPAGISGDALVFVQPFRPDFLALQRAGHRIAPEAPETRFRLIFVHLTRHRARNESWIGEALRRLAPGGWLVVAGGLKQGADSMARRLKQVFPGCVRFSRNHGVVVAACVADPSAHVAAFGAMPHAAEGWATAPGAFSAGGVDPASRLLFDTLPDDLSGRVADFGAGWGFLSAGIAMRFPGVCHVDLYEADYLSLEAAKANMAARAETTEAGFFWIDLVGEPVTRKYDVIVMNPPFHDGRAADPALGNAFIKTAANALKPGGRLFLVANRGLPYEAVLAGNFAKSGEAARDTSYKVLWGMR